MLLSRCCLRCPRESSTASGLTRHRRACKIHKQYMDDSLRFVRYVHHIRRTKALQAKQQVVGAEEADTEQTQTDITPSTSGQADVNMPDAEPLPPSTSPPLHLPLPHPSSSKSGHPQRTHQLVPAQYRDISDSSDKNDTGDPDPDELGMVQNGHDKIAVKEEDLCKGEIVDEDEGRRRV